jgi:hypothetical protein
LRRHRYLPTGALALAAAVTVVCVGGCGPIEYLNQVGYRAAGAVAAAKRAEAERYAPFEFTAAQEYLHKAREEAGYSQYETSIEYGRRAEEMANRARAIAITATTPQSSVAPDPAAAPRPGSAPGPGAPVEKTPSSSSLPEGVDNEVPGQASKKPAAPTQAPARSPKKRPGTE